MSLYGEIQKTATEKVFSTYESVILVLISVLMKVS